jgi:hydrogenase 3 maturation protease
MNFTDLQVDLRDYLDELITFVGLGNRLRGDDAAGLELLDLIEKSGIFPGAYYVSAGTNPENYLEQILSANPGLVVFLDACDLGNDPGSIRWLNNDEIETAGISTHAFSIIMIEKYLNLERKTECRYLAIQPSFTGPGSGLSAETRQGIEAFFE